jgi:membrane-bound serine protease (ClpP class)
VAEPFVISHGLLAIGGILAFVLGSSMLIDTAVPGLGVRMELIVPAALLLAAVTLFLLTRALRLRAGRPLTGLESMIGELGELASAVDPDHASGKVFVHGEYWNATAQEPLPAGTRVRVEAIYGSTLQVARAPELGAR